MTLDLIRTLRDENDRLREQIAALRGALCECPPFPEEWRLSRSQTRVFSVLVRQPCPSRDAIMTALYSDRPAADAVFDTKLVDIFICKIRRKIRPFGITIRTEWGHGYALDAATRARFAQAVRPALRIAA